MHIQRYRRRRSSYGCLFLLTLLLVSCGIMILLLLPALPGLTLQVAGFTRKGLTDTVFTDVTPVTVIQSPSGPRIQRVTINLGRFGTRVLDAASSDYEMMNATDNAFASILFTERAVRNLCIQMSSICAGDDNRFQNLVVDLRPGGVVIYTDVVVLAAAIRLRVGIVFHLDATARQFIVEGVDVDGILYDVPPNSIGVMVQDAERIGNEILHALSIDAAGRHYNLSQVRIDDNQLWVILQS